MIQLIVFLIFIISLLGALFIVLKQIPALVKLPQDGSHGFKKHAFIATLERKVKDSYFHFFEKQMLLHTLLSKFRVWIMKMERYIGGLLMNIRKRAQELDREVKKKR